MKIILFLLLNVSMILHTAIAANLTVNFIGIDQANGFIRIALFPDSHKAQFPQPPDGNHSPHIKKYATKANINGTSLTIKNIAPGTYAISVLHDLNNNDAMDYFLGIPTEPYGNSGQYTILKPDYDESKFTLTNQDLILEIKVH